MIIRYTTVAPCVLHGLTEIEDFMGYCLECQALVGHALADDPTKHAADVWDAIERRCEDIQLRAPLYCVKHGVIGHKAGLTRKCVSCREAEAYRSPLCFYDAKNDVLTISMPSSTFPI